MTRILEHPFVVKSQVVGVVTDLVYAASPEEAIARVRGGRGDRICDLTDLNLEPLSIVAEPEPETVSSGGLR